MAAFGSRIRKLEAGSAVRRASPAVRRWLGTNLTPQERDALDVDSGIDPDFDEIDLSGYSPAVQKWLGH